MVGAVAASIGRVPCGVWTKMSLTMVTVAQTSVAIPYALGRVEDFFMSAARRKSNKHKVERKVKMGGRGDGNETVVCYFLCDLYLICVCQINASL